MDSSIVTSAITAAAAVVVAVVGERQRRQHRTTARTVRDVKEQVANSHSTNLRDDIDRVLDGIEGIRDDIREERADRRAADGALARRIQRIEDAL